MVGEEPLVRLVLRDRAAHVCDRVGRQTIGMLTAASGVGRVRLPAVVALDGQELVRDVDFQQVVAPQVQDPQPRPLTQEIHDPRRANLVVHDFEGHDRLHAELAACQVALVEKAPHHPRRGSQAPDRR